MNVSLLYLLYLGTLATSLFCTITLLWLGVTVALNAERRVWGTWIASGGLLFGSAFFAIHSTVVGQSPWALATQMAVWWKVGWTPFVAAPFLWYLVMAWYSGVLPNGRHRWWAPLVGLIGASAMLLLLFGNPLPTYNEVVDRAPVAVFTVAGIPTVVLIYPAFSLLCIVLSLLALYYPETSGRFMGDMARQRARPWLAACSLMLLAVTITAGIAVAWLLERVRTGEAPLLSLRSLTALIGLDLLLSGMIAVLSILLGKAVVAYEIFTGQVLPRGGLARYWRNSLFLAAGYGIGLGLCIVFNVAPIYQIMLVTLLVAALYALLVWQMFAERERGVGRLRPFVSSQRLYDRLLGPNSLPDVDLLAPFRALCDELLSTRRAYLVALGPLNSLISEPISYPNESANPLPTTTASLLAALLHGTQHLCVAIDPSLFGNAVWAVPLWSERGLIGALLLGEKRDRGLYTQEEIELARAACERLLDTRASAELSQRLMALQRQRLVESQLIDRRTRRVLHDDVLPQIHAMILALGDRDEQLQHNLADVHRQIADLLHELPPTVQPDLARIGLIGALHRAVEGELRGAFDDVCWQVAPAAEAHSRLLPSTTAEVLFYASREVLRNAARHARGDNSQRNITLVITIDIDHATQPKPTLTITIADDGVGLGAASSPGGSGSGLALHSTLLALLGGTISADSTTNGARFVLSLPIVLQDSQPIPYKQGQALRA